ncbi:MAG: DUF4328 domain-containing protein [Acidimicrobiia bacterium]
MPPAGWHPDPSGRHRLRYWDGAQWTAYVSDQGETAVDPIPGAADATTTEPVATTAPVAAAAAPAAGLGAPPPSVQGPNPGLLGPQADWGTVTPAGAAPAMMRNIGGLAAALTVVLWITVAVSAFGAFAFVNRVMVANDILDFDFNVGSGGFGELVDLQNRADDADTFVGTAALMLLVCSVVIFVLLLIWMWRVAKNAELTGRSHPRFGPGWTIGAWFIPFASLVIPLLVMQDLWRASDPTVGRGDPAWRQRPGSRLIGWWWAAYLVATLRFVSSGDANSRSELENLRTTDSLAAVGSLVAIAAAILLIRVVRGITRRQVALIAGDPTPLV